MPDRHDLSLLYVEDEPVAREELARFLRRRVREVVVEYIIERRKAGFM